MRKTIEYVLTGIIAYLISHYFVRHIVLPTLYNYPRLTRVMARFPATTVFLILFLTLTFWLGWVQWNRRQISPIYGYLVYSVYLLLLFIVLFTKADVYHAISLNPFDFIQPDRKILLEALLNVLYFIPLGGLYHLRASFLETNIIAFLTILGIETLQFAFYLGTFAISDLLLNWLGCLVGFGLWSLAQHHFNR
ncbi:VanZ family protein [Latilactobacillus graminis]|uniref:Integral membrane protein n=2 Tax=Latilactobacillus graminis TaxID=60519 RepID=A0AA89L0M3_9LACO|nr:VanZ family protein [Latilactobacillus graminis]KRM23358.1 integral membrane protein [Latilactobacillus graminis DSM 20719]QFP80289.1 VanZ family protein [Latilactobacillus graminis]